MNKKQSLIFGIYPVLEAFKANKSIDKLYLQKDLSSDKLNQIKQLAAKENIPISIVPVQKLHQLTRSNHQGVALQLAPISFTAIEEVLTNKKSNLFLLLDQVTDVRNFGAIIRTAECTGVDAIIIPKSGSAPINGDTVKTSAGAVFQVPICKVDHIKDAIFHLQAANIKIIAATEKTDQYIYHTDLRSPIAIVMGSEGKGISKSVLRLVDEKVSLPLKGEINSLNVSVACGAFLYEVVRQREN